MHGHRLLCVFGLLGAVLGAGLAPLGATESSDPWPGLVQDIFNNRPMSDGSDVIGLEMPARAEDAAIVPVTLRSKLAPDDDRRVRPITLPFGVMGLCNVKPASPCTTLCQSRPIAGLRSQNGV